jgi:hypothetical protein
MNTKIKSIARDIRYKARNTRGRTMWTAVGATANDRHRLEGSAEELKGRLNERAKTERPCTKDGPDR